MADRPPSAHEASPLLPKPHDGEPERIVSPGRRFTVLLAVRIFVVFLGAGMASLPTLRILEDIICRRRLPGGADEVDEKLCKGMDDVQGELSFVIAMYSMFEVLPGEFPPPARWEMGRF